MTTPPPDIAAIAGKLTKAQRHAIIHAQCILFGKQWLLSSKTIRTVTDNLRAKGLAEFHDIYRDRLTDHGLAVRAYLLSKEQNDG